YLLVFYALVSFLTSFFLFFFPSSLAPPVLHSFPTRRSSDLFVWRICGASAQKPPQRNKLTRLADQIARTVATFLYVPIPTANNNKSPPSACLCPILSPNCCYLSLTVAFSRQQFLSCPLVVLNLSATVPECPKL